MKKILLVVTALSLQLFLGAQEKVEYVNGTEILEQSKTLWAKDKYHEAYEKVCEISPNDTCYTRSIINRTFYLLNDPDLDDDFKYPEVVRLTQEALKDDKTLDKYYYYFNQIAALMNMEKYSETLLLIDEVLEKYPKNEELYLKKGVVLEKQKKYNLAAEAYKQSLNYNPFYADAHLNLGLLCYRGHKITQALICIDTYLALSPDGARSFGILESMNHSLSSANDEEMIDVVISKDDEAFEEIDLLISNRIALQKKYKIKSKIDIAFTRQNHLLFDQLKSFEGNGGFFDEKYIPFFENITSKGMFDDFIYTTCFSIENPKYKKIVQGKTDEIKKFIVASFQKLAELYGEQDVVIDGEKQLMNFDYSYEGLSGIGKMKDDQPVGRWELYDANSKFVRANGEFDEEGKKTGSWKWYFENGSVETESSFVAGENDQVYKQYFPNGQVNYDVEYDQGKVQGAYHEFNRFGALIVQKNFDDSKVHGLYKEYFKVGSEYPKLELNYNQGKLDGMVTKYYLNGQKKMEINLVDGLREGIEKTYYANGNPKTEVNIVNDLPKGKFVEYFPDGKIKKEGNYKDGKYSGTWTEYYHNGNLKVQKDFENDKLNGEFLEYDADGILYTKYIYRKGDLVEVFSYDKSGKEVFSEHKKRGELYFKGYSPYGILVSEGQYDVNGGKEGTWKYYTPNGILNQQESFREGKLEGELVHYFPNGTIHRSSNYHEDTLTGYYRENFIDGKMSYQGWYKSNERQGVFLKYFPNGEVYEKYYFQSGIQNGAQIDFDLEGDTSNVTYYYLDDVEGTHFYNNDGQLIKKYTRSREKEYREDYYFDTGEIRATYTMNYGIFNGPYIAYYPSGKKQIEGQYLNGYKEGEWTWFYENGQVETSMSYIIGDIDGVRKDYHENGKLKEKTTYILGVVDGLNEEFNDQGIHINLLTYDYGNINGKRIFYSQEGNIQLIRFYNNGRLIGYSYLDKNGKELDMIPIDNETVVIKAVFDNGKASREMTIEKGQFTGDYNSFYYSGQLESKTHYVDDSREGEAVTYYKNGTQKSMKNYLHGELHGPYKTFYENGKTKEEGVYSYDYKNGLFVRYAQNGQVLSQRYYATGRFVGNK